ncbi:hypothetical protein [Streptomyces koyangensis]|uniref:Uncharacterized protein n=1 Tax=Streptomyces koyangensis TaxID=188770 RepID=A0ABX7E945_9ACTN|nr:hypothetical protein [Streptomyces koyangensis]QRF00906.1 hypothetical protein G9U55_00990 [Streptomyces koyangensis]
MFKVRRWPRKVLRGRRRELAGAGVRPALRARIASRVVAVASTGAAGDPPVAAMCWPNVRWRGEGARAVGRADSTEGEPPRFKLGVNPGCGR